MKKRDVAFIFLSLIVFLSCEKEEVTKESVQRLIITENSKTNDVPMVVTHVEKFDYQAKRLILYSNAQTYGNEQILNHTTVSYAHESFTTSDESGNIHVYQMKNRYASLCQFTEPGTENTRAYLFSYNEDGYLDKLIENINNEKNREITLRYTEGSLASIQTIVYDQGDLKSTTTQHFNIGSQPNKDQLPFLSLTEEYPFYFHKVAFYAGIMGKSSKYLPESSFYEGNADEKTVYQYKTDAEGRIFSLTVEIINHDVSYKRTFGYRYE